MADIVLTQNTNASLLSIQPSDNLCLNGYVLTLDADIVCNIISGGSAAGTAGSGNISIPDQTRSITCAKIGMYNHTVNPMFVFSNGANLTLITTEFLAATRLINAAETNTIITLTIKTPDDDYSTILTCPNPPVDYTNSLINVSSSNSVVNLRGIFRGQQSGTNARAMFTFGVNPTVSVSGCLVGGAGSSTNSAVSTAGGITITAFASGDYAGKALIADAAIPLVLTAAASGKQIVINGNVYGSGSASVHGFNLNYATPTIINGDVYGGSTSAGNAYGVNIGAINISLTVNGTVYGGTASNTNYGVYQSAKTGCSLTFNNPSGNALCGKTASAYYNTGTCSGTAVYVSGNVVGGDTGSSVNGINGGGGGITYTIDGNAIGGTSSGGQCAALNISAGSITLNGNAVGGTTIATNYGMLLASAVSATVNGKLQGTLASACRLNFFTGSFTLTAGSDGVAIQPTSSGVGLEITGTTTAPITINGDVFGSSGHINGHGVLLNNSNITSVITINGSVSSGSIVSSSGYGLCVTASGAARVYINGDCNAYQRAAVYFATSAGAADVYIGGDVVKHAAQNVLVNDATSAGCYVCVAYGKGYKDGSGNPLLLSNVANANGVYPNSGYGWVVNAKLTNATDFITAMTQLPYGRFILVEDLAVSSSSYVATTFYGVLMGKKGKTVPKLTTLSLSNGGSGAPLTTTNNGALENLQIITANTGTANVLAATNNGSILRCFVQSGTGGALVGINNAGKEIKECYSRIGRVVNTNNGIVTGCYKSVNDGSAGTYRSDTDAKYKASYPDWNFKTTWDIVTEGMTFPVLNFRSLGFSQGFFGGLDTGVANSLMSSEFFVG